MPWIPNQTEQGWQQNLAERVLNILRYVVRGVFAVVALVVALFVCYFVAKFAWHLVLLCERSLFANPW